MTWYLFIDDIRDPCTEYSSSEEGKLYVTARTVEEAIQLVEEKGVPKKMSLDHDLGWSEKTMEHDTVMRFLKWFADYILDKKITKKDFPAWYAHSANPIGVKNINSFLNSLKRASS